MWMVDPLSYVFQTLFVCYGYIVITSVGGVVKLIQGCILLC
jgi:hypothetical protein